MFMSELHLTNSTKTNLVTHNKMRKGSSDTTKEQGKLVPFEKKVNESCENIIKW